jgi:hypothetical protein
MTGQYENESSRSRMKGMDWIDQAHVKDRWQVLENEVTNLQVPQNAGNFSTS